MRQQVMDGDFPRGRDHAVFWHVFAPNIEWTDVVIRRLFQNRDLHVGEFGYVARHWIVGPKESFLHRDQCGHTEYRLGGRHHDEHRVVGHGYVVVDVHAPVCFEVHDLTAARDRRDGALDLAGVDVALHHLADPRQPFARHADFLGCGTRQFGGHERIASKTAAIDTTMFFVRFGNTGCLLGERWPELRVICALLQR